MLRELAEETGLRGTIVGVVGVHSNVYTGPTSGDNIHGIRLIYRVRTGGSLRTEFDESTDAARWFNADDDAVVHLSDHARFALGHQS